MRSAAVIGAGFGGLALAIRLQSAGVATMLVEARDKPGGCAYAWVKEGFTFDGGPATVTDPAGLKELWALSGRDIAADVTLMPVTPFCRFSWPDGTTFDHSSDEAALRREIEKLDPADVDGYTRFAAYAAAVYREGHEKLGQVAVRDLASMLRAAPTLARYQAWRSVHGIVSSFVKNEKLRQALGVHTLRTGGNPMSTSAIHASHHALEKEAGIWFPKGGAHALAGAMAAHFERLGGALRLGDAVEEIETLGDRATGIRTRSGWRGSFDAVATNADVLHSYRDLLPGSARGQRAAAALARKRWSPSLFVVHFGIKGRWPGIPHRMTLFGPRYEGLLTDIYDHGVLSADFSLHLHHPTATDPSLAPDGCSTFHALVPVPHIGKSPVDWSVIGPILQERVLDEVERRLIPDLRERIIVSFHYTPADLARDLNAHLGSAFSLEPLLIQSGWLRVSNRDDKIANLYFVGAGTGPGPGVPSVIASAKATARLMLDDLKVAPRPLPIPEPVREAPRQGDLFA